MAAAMAEEVRPGRTGQPYSSGEKKMALLVLEYLRTVHTTMSEAELEAATGKATGVSVRSLQRFKKEAKEGDVHSPPSKRKRKSPIMDSVDCFDEACVRRILAAFYERGEIPTTKDLLQKVKEAPVHFKGSQSSLYRLLKNMGFCFKRVESGRKILMEREDIVLGRCKYLRILKENRSSDNPRSEIYLDETWVNQNECVSKCWTTPDGAMGPKVKTGRGARFIVVHAGGVNGFVPGGLLMFKSKNGNKGDYHDSMNHETFSEWFEKQLLPNIPPRSLIIMDNASYHNKMLNKAPVKRSRKEEIIRWLEYNDIAHNPAHTKPELLNIVKNNMDRQIYAIDHLASEHGHEVLRLPPYHCQLNPIELVWAQVKDHIRKNNSNGDQTLCRVEQLTKKAIEKITATDWEKCVVHTKKLEEDFAERDLIMNHFIEHEPVVVDLEDTSSEEEW